MILLHFLLSMLDSIFFTDNGEYFCDKNVRINIPAHLFAMLKCMQRTTDLHVVEFTE